MKLDHYGPILVWAIVFTIGAAIKVVAFPSALILFEIGPDASLWALGVLFTIAASESTYSGARIVRNSKRESPNSFKTRYSVVVDDSGFNPKYLYLFLVSLLFWIVILLLSGTGHEEYIRANKYNSTSLLCIAVSAGMAASMLMLALRALVETTK